MHTKWHEVHCERRSAWWHRKLWVAAFFIFQGPTESLMLYADALHCNYRSHWSLLTVLPLMYKIFCFPPEITSLAFHGAWSRGIKQHQNCGDSTFGTSKCAHEGGEREAEAVPHLITPADSWKALRHDKCWFLMHSWNASSWSELGPTGARTARFLPQRAAVHTTLGTVTDVQPIWGPLWKRSLSRFGLTVPWLDRIITCPTGCADQSAALIKNKKKTTTTTQQNIHPSVWQRGNETETSRSKICGGTVVFQNSTETPGEDIIHSQGLISRPDTADMFR